MILDTCALLWLAKGAKELSDSARARIDAEPSVCVSAISGFEIATKVRRGKLQLPAGVKDWFDSIVDHHDIEMLPLDLELCVAAAELPAIHSDPCDRFIVAAALRRGMPVVTVDPVFADYGVEVVS